MTETRYVEIVDPFDELTIEERACVARAFERRPGANRGRDEFVLRRGVSRRAVAAAAAIIEKHRLMGSLPGLPEPPAPGEWRVWHYRQAGCKIDALAAPDAPVRADLHGSTHESRRQLVMRAEKAVEQFRRAAPAWWFRVCAELMAPDPPVTK
jgi:hypothetical protein